MRKNASMISKRKIFFFWRPIHRISLFLSVILAGFLTFGQAAELSGDKLYFSHNDLVLSEEGMFVDLGNHDYIQIPSLQFDHTGYYCELSENQLPKSGYTWNGQILKRCSGCGEEYFITCDNPDCQIKQEADRRREEKKAKK